MRISKFESWPSNILRFNYSYRGLCFEAYNLGLEPLSFDLELLIFGLELLNICLEL